MTNDTYCANLGKLVSLAKFSIFSPQILMPLYEQKFVKLCMLIQRPCRINTSDSLLWWERIGVTAFNTLLKGLYNVLMAGGRNNYLLEVMKFS